jgi:hypothetical protein
MLLQMGDGREGQMVTIITTQMTPQGLLVPRSALGEWLERGVETVREQEQITIRPRPAMLDEREEAIRILEEAGLLVKPDWEPTVPPVSDAELEELARKFSVGRPLSQIIMEERAEGW